MAEIGIFVGTMYGNSLLVAEEAEAILVRINKRNRAKMAAQREAEAWKKKVDAWLESRVNSIDNANASDEAKLQVYAEDRLKNSKRKSVNLPSGKFGFRKGQPKIEHDDAILMEYCKASNPSFIKVKESLDWAGLKKDTLFDGEKIIDKNGEVLPGITVHPAEDTFYVSVKENEK